MTDILLRQTDFHGVGFAGNTVPSGWIIDQVVWEINEPDKFKITMDPMAPYAGNIKLANKQETQIWREGELLTQGCLRTKSKGLGDTHMAFNGYGVFDYFNYRSVLSETLTYTDLEQMQIAGSLVNYAQSSIMGASPDLNIVVGGYTPSGIIRSRSYIADRKHNIMAAIKEFSTLDDGFDQEVILNPDGSRVWMPYYPYKGSDRSADYGWFEYGRQVIDYAYNEDAMKLATLLDTTGGTTASDPFNPLAGGEKQHFIYEDVPASNRHGVHIAVLPSGSRSDMAWLTARAQRAAMLRRDPIILTAIKCRQGGRWPVLVGNLKTGDQVKVRIDHGAIQVNGLYRVKTLTWTPTDDLVQLEFSSALEAAIGPLE